MLEPLDSEKLSTLVCDGHSKECHTIRAAKRFFAKNQVIQGVNELLLAFGEWRPHLYYDHRNREMWHIQFPDRPFDTLYLRAKGHSLEIFEHRTPVTSKDICEIFKRKKCIASIDIVGRPQNWVLMLQWLWAYWDELYIASVKNGSMLRPLDYQKLDALAKTDDDADCDSIRRAKAHLGKEKNLPTGIVSLFEGWEVFAPQIHHDKDVERCWWITFCNSPFRSLRIQPSIDDGVVDIYAFDKFVISYHILDNPKTPDRNMWQGLLRFVWDYGKRRQEHKQQWEEIQRLSPKKYAISQSRSKRTEKPLLHKVLNTAGFKAKRKAALRMENMRIVPSAEDEVMQDVATGIYAEKSSSHQPFEQQSALHATNPNAWLGTSWTTKNMEDCQITKVGLEGVNMKDLQIVDYHP